MAKARKLDLMGTVKTVAAGGVGGYAGDMLTGTLEVQLVKQDPKYINAAPAITAIAGILLSAFTQKNTLINDAANGMAIVSGTELIQSLTAPKPPTGGGGESSSGGENMDGRGSVNSIRLNANNNALSNEYMY